MEARIHSAPVAEELAAAYWQLRALGGLDGLSWCGSVWEWLDAWRDAEFLPVLLEFDGVFPAVIWLTDYDDVLRCARVHFAASAAYRPKSTLVLARVALRLLLAGGMIDTLIADVRGLGVKAQRMARSFADIVEVVG